MYTGLLFDCFVYFVFGVMFGYSDLFVFGYLLLPLSRGVAWACVALLCLACFAMWLFVLVLVWVGVCWFELFV